MSSIQLPELNPISSEDWDYYLSKTPKQLIDDTLAGLKTQNRFYLDSRFLKLIYYYVVDRLSTTQSVTVINSNLKLENYIPVLYRARIYEEDDGFDKINKKGRFAGYNKKDSFVPPVEKNVGVGRINPSNIRYLYAATDIKTCILEVCTTPATFVNVAKIRIKKDLIMFDLTKNYSSIDASTLENSKWVNGFFIELQRLFQKPVFNADNYLLCQNISEFLKLIGLDGIMFRSSYRNDITEGSEGINCVIFNCDKCDVISTKLYYIHSICIVFD